MTDRYEPASDFLKAVIAEEVPFTGSELAEANLARLIAFTRDPDRSNRDWAALLLSQQEIDTPAVREALLAAARDPDEDVRAEAVLGLAQRDPALALPFVREALACDRAGTLTFEAAALIGDPSLVEDLEAFAEPSDNPWVDGYVLEALEACRRGSPAEPTSEEL